MRTASRGVTLLELVIYMIIAVVLATSAVLVYRPTGVNARYQAERLRADLRHVQMAALTLGVRLRVTTESGNYSVACVGSTTGACAATVSPSCPPPPWP